MNRGSGGRSRAYSDEYYEDEYEDQVSFEITLLLRDFILTFSTFASLTVRVTIIKKKRIITRMTIITRTMATMKTSPEDQ